VIKVSWANTNKTIIIWDFAIGWDWEDFFTAKAEVDTMIESVMGTVDSIFLVPSDMRIPPNAIANIRKIVVTRHHRHDKVVVVGSRGLLARLMSISRQLLPSTTPRLHYVNTIKEAYAIIEQAQQEHQQRTKGA
jgi:hypothetical protein